MDTKQQISFSILLIIGFICLCLGLFNYLSLKEIYEYINNKPIILTFPASLIFFILAHLYRNYQKNKDVLGFMSSDIKEYKSAIDNSIKEINLQLLDFQLMKENLIYSKFLEIDMSELSYIDSVFLSKQEQIIDEDDEECKKYPELTYFVKGLNLLHKFKNQTKNGQGVVIDKANKALLESADKNFDCAIDKAVSKSKYLAEYWNYRGLTQDYALDFIKAITFYLNSIDNDSYEKPYFNIACTLAVIFNKIEENSDKIVDYTEIPFDIIKTKVNSCDHLDWGNGKIELHTTDVKDDVEKFKHFCFIAALKALNISIAKRPSNIMVALKKEDNELVVFHKNTVFRKEMVKHLNNFHSCIISKPFQS